MLFDAGLGEHKVILKQAALLLTTYKEQESDCQRIRMDTVDICTKMRANLSNICQKTPDCPLPRGDASPKSMRYIF